MRRLVLIAIFGIIFTMNGCSGLVDEKQMETFFSDLGDTSITVYPTYIKRMEKDNDGKPTGRDASNSGYELTETERLAAFLRCECLANVTVSSEQIPLGGKWPRTQAGIFKASTQAFGEYIVANPIETEYAMMVEYAIPFDRIWAVHAYVVNARGEPVWILHLNEHFDVFTEINPRIPADATDVLLKFLRFGWPVTSAKCSYQASETPADKSPAGVLYDFEAEWAAGFDQNNIPLGFSTFNDSKSIATISRTNDHPPRSGEADGNNVLKLEVDVDAWAGVVNTFENETVDTWVPRDWRELQSLSFWLYGNNSGTQMYFEILDNRKGCSSYDDAERFGLKFVDDFSGWRKLTIKFDELNRVDITSREKRAPDDGLGLNNVHGWGLGVLTTRGPMTFYIDDFELHPGRVDR